MCPWSGGGSYPTCIIASIRMLKSTPTDENYVDMHFLSMHSHMNTWHVCVCLFLFLMRRWHEISIKRHLILPMCILINNPVTRHPAQTKYLLVPILWVCAYVPSLSPNQRKAKPLFLFPSPHEGQCPWGSHSTKSPPCWTRFIAFNALLNLSIP